MKAHERSAKNAKHDRNERARMRGHQSRGDYLYAKMKNKLWWCEDCQEFHRNVYEPCPKEEE